MALGSSSSRIFSRYRYWIQACGSPTPYGHERFAYSLHQTTTAGNAANHRYRGRGQAKFLVCSIQFSQQFPEIITVRQSGYYQTDPRSIHIASRNRSMITSSFSTTTSVFVSTNTWIRIDTVSSLPIVVDLVHKSNMDQLISGYLPRRFS